MPSDNTAHILQEGQTETRAGQISAQYAGAHRTGAASPICRTQDPKPQNKPAVFGVSSGKYTAIGRGGNTLRISIDQIRVGPGRREIQPEHIRELAGRGGLAQSYHCGQDYTLIAGRHRLEAAKLLSWTEIECTVSELTGLQAELAEIEENFMRVNWAP